MENFLDFDPEKVTKDEEILTIYKLQNFLRELTEVKIPETVEFCLNEEINKTEIAVQIRIFIQIRPQKIYIYTDLLFSLLQKIGPDFKPSIFENIPSLVIKLLYLKGCFLLNEIQAITKNKRDLEIYFAPEFKLTKLSRGNNKNFADKSGNIYEYLIKNDYAKYNELILNDFLKDSNEYAIKTDNISKFENFDFQSLSFTEIEEFASLSALYCSYKCFQLFLNQNEDKNILTNKVIEKAVEGGNEEILNLIIARGIDLTRFLPFAIKYHQHKFINMCLSQGKATFNLTQASASLDIKIILYALHNNLKEDRTWDQYERSPLHFAAFYGDCVLGKFYINNGFDINEKDADGRSVLYEAISSKHPAFVNLLIDHKADITAKTNEGVSIFQRASESTNDQIKSIFQSLSYFYT